jgi:hypothetical protein
MRDTCAVRQLKRGKGDLTPPDRTRTGVNEAAALISIFASAFAQGAVVSPTSVFSKTSLPHVVQYVFYDIELVSKVTKSGKKGVNRAYNQLILLLYGLFRGLLKKH